MRRTGIKLFLFSTAMLASGWVSGAERKELRPEPYYSTIAQRVAMIFPREHLLRSAIDEGISRKTWTNYLASFDYDRLYFLQSDIDEFRAEEKMLADDIKTGRLDFAYRVQNVFQERVSNRMEYANAVLAKGFTLEEKETYHWKRKDAPWAKDEAELNELWRKKIKNEYIQATLAREAADKAATNKVNVAATNTVDSAEQPEKKKLTPEETIRQRYKQFQTVLGDTDAEMILSRLLMAFAQAHDPHSAYMSPATSEDFDIEMKLSLEGIGALLSSEDGAAKIVRVIPGGPADMDKSEKRLRAGDKIIAVGQGDSPTEDILHLPLQKIVQKIRGRKGTKVSLVVIPASDATGTTTKRVELIRDEVKLEEQAATSKIQQIQDFNGKTQKLGVVTLPAFYANMRVSSEKAAGYKSSAHDVEKALEELKTNNVTGILLDLRNNGGGSLLEAVKMTGLFIRDGPVVQVKERYSIKPIQDPDDSVAYEGPLVVLVNRLSASASEILAGALQDYGRAIIVGDSKTHGKGTVQTILQKELGRDPRFGSVKLTTASYYRISGNSTQLKGVASDIVVPSALDFMELGEEYMPNALQLSAEQSASYTKIADLSQPVATLRDKSENRRAEDSRFKAYARLLERIKIMNKTEKLPLNLADRRELTKIEKELQEMEDELNAVNGPLPDDPKKGGKPDLVLTEGLRILADYAALSRQVVAPDHSARTVPERKGFLDRLLDWMRGE